MQLFNGSDLFAVEHNVFEGDIRDGLCGAIHIRSDFARRSDADIAEGDAVNLAAAVAHRIFVVPVQLKHEQRRLIRALFGKRGQGLVFRLLQDGRLAVFVYIDFDVFVEHAADIAVVDVADIQRRAGNADHLAMAENDVVHPLGARFHADVQGVAPVVPDHAVFHEDVRAVVAEIDIALDAHGIVVRAQKTAGNARVRGVVHIDAVGIVPPVADEFDVFHIKIAARERGDVVDQRIADHDSLDAHVVAADELHGVLALGVEAVGIRIIGLDFAHDLLFAAAVIEDAAAADADIIRVFGMKPAVHHRGFVDVYRLPAVQLHDADVVKPRPEVQNVLPFRFLRVFLRYVAEKMDRVPVTARHEHAAARLFGHEADLVPADGKHFPRRARFEHGALYGIFPFDDDLRVLVRLETDEIREIALVFRTLMPRPAAVDGIGGNVRRLHGRGLSADGDADLLRALFTGFINAYHNTFLLCSVYTR